MSGGAVDLNVVLRDYLREALDDDARAAAGAARPSQFTLAMLEEGLAETRDALAHRDPRNVQAIVTRLAERHGVPPDARDSLAIGVLEAELRIYQKLIRRAKGEDASVFTAPEEDAAKVQSTAPEASPEGRAPAAPMPPPSPLASSVVEPFFVHREAIDRLSHHDMSQERTTLRLFADICGDKPINAYGRADASAFLTTLRRLPVHYGKSPNDKGRSAAAIIAEADAKGAARIGDKTVKRHLTALSQFLRFAMDQGHITKTARDEMVGGHRFREERKARKQRDAWTPEDLKALFASPVWTGCHPIRRSAAGPQIIRDARFWLPILALYHGARLEELADLYRRDVWCDDGTWAIHIVETDGNADTGDRDLKSDAAERTLPLHPELVRLGFLDYVKKVAPNADDPLFPDLKPQGRDRKRGPRMTRWFVEYRKATKLFRPGVSMHAFRHTAITRLTDAINDVQQERHRDHMMGHATSGGGEGRIRYDKGPGLEAVAATLALLRYPEVDLSHLWAQAE